MTTNQVMVAVDDTHATTKEANEILGLIGAQSSAEKGQPNGIASLGADGKVPSAQLIAYDMLSELSASVVEHSGDGTLTIGAWNVLAGSAEYTVTLPTAVGHTGEFIGIRAADNAFAVLLAPYSGETVFSSLQGDSTFGWYICGNNAAILVSDGTYWRMVEESRGINLCTLNFSATESAATINARINALPRTVEASSSATGLLYLDFADGEYTIDQGIYIAGFNGRALYVRGNTSENSNVLHTNQAVLLNGSASEVNVLTVLGCTLAQILVTNLAVAVKTDVATRIGISMSYNAQVDVRGCYVYGNSDAYGYGMSQSKTPQGLWRSNYVSNVKYGMFIQDAECSLITCDDTGTPPKYGIAAYNAAVIGPSSAMPSGSVADRTRTNGVFLPAEEGDLVLSDVTTLNASTKKHGFAPKAVAPAAGQLTVLGIANGETAWSNKVLTCAAVADATGAGDVVAQLNALLASLRATKIIAT